MLFGVNNQEGPENIVLDRGADPRQRGERDIILNFETPYLGNGCS